MPLLDTMVFLHSTPLLKFMHRDAFGINVLEFERIVYLSTVTSIYIVYRVTLTGFRSLDTSWGSVL